MPIIISITAVLSLDDVIILWIPLVQAVEVGKTQAQIDAIADTLSSCAKFEAVASSYARHLLSLPGTRSFYHMSHLRFFVFPSPLIPLCAFVRSWKKWQQR